MSESFEISTPVNKEEIRKALDGFVEEVSGGEVCESGVDTLSATLPTIHRFYAGPARVFIRWRSEQEHATINVDISMEDVQLSGGGKLLLATGALGSIPWLFWPFFPSLISLMPVGVLFLFLAWLGVARKPHMFTTRMVAGHLKKYLEQDKT